MMERLRPALKAVLSDKKRAACLALALIGSVLLFFAGGGRSAKSASDGETLRLSDVWRAEARLEARARRLLSDVKGVGRAQVTVTLDDLSATVYLRNASTDAGGGSVRSEYVLVSGSGGRDGLARCVLAPEIRGVAVCCRGGADPQVRREVSLLLSAAFGVPANRVYVTAMQ